MNLNFTLEYYSWKYKGPRHLFEHQILQNRSTIQQSTSSLAFAGGGICLRWFGFSILTAVFSFPVCRLFWQALIVAACFSRSEDCAGAKTVVSNAFAWTASDRWKLEYPTSFLDGPKKMGEQRLSLQSLSRSKANTPSRRHGNLMQVGHAWWCD